MLPTRRKTRQVRVGPVLIGNGAPLSVQTMTKAPPEDVEANLAQIREAARLGCAIVRMAVPSVARIKDFGRVAGASPLPVAADVHFDCRIALGAIRAGAAKLRINPGNMRDWQGLAEVAAAAREAAIPIRIGLNSGSIKHHRPGAREPAHALMVETALEYAARFEDMGFSDLVLSLKDSDPIATIQANRAVAARCDYPLHLGVTAAGPEQEALLKSALALGGLLADGIGDTIRLSFTGPPAREVAAGRELLRAAGLLRDRPAIFSCPTCGRASVELAPIVEEVRRRLARLRAPLRVAVMGCEVNGPGEAREADLGLAITSGRAVIFASGREVTRVSPDRAVDALVEAAEQLASHHGRHDRAEPA